MRLLALTGALALSAAGLVLPVATAAPAAAAVCGDGSGVSVVVDGTNLPGGGGSESYCVSGGGGTAQRLFGAAGVDLDLIQGFVCRVDGQPATEPCNNTPPANAYWSLWWSDGSSGTWQYSNFGVSGLQVPAGGSVGWRFSLGDRTPPSISAPRHSASTGGSGGTDGTSGSGGTSGGDSAGGTGTGTPSAGSSSDPSPDASTSAGDSATDERDGSRGDGRTGRDRERADTEGSAQRDGRERGRGSRDGQDEEGHGAVVFTGDPIDPDAQAVSVEPEGLPVWVAPAVLALLAALGGGVVAVRRRRGGTPGSA